MAYQFQTPTKIISGIGSTAEIIKELNDLHAKKVLLITDPGLVQAGVAQQVVEMLKQAAVEVEIFDAVEPDPSIQVATKAAEMAKNVKANVLIALGGGSAIDTAKSAALLVTNGGYLKDYAGVNKVVKPILPLIAVPTTAGTGSEVTIFAVMSDPEKQEKFTISGALIAPAVAVLDPLLTLKLPPSVTAFTGMDALTHAIEAFTSSIAQPPTDALALSAIKLVLKHLPVAVGRGDNIKARDGMLQASLLAGIAFNNAFLGLAHAIASPLGGHFHVPHGLANAVMLPYVMEYNLPTAVRRYAEIGCALGLQAVGDTPRAVAEKTVAAITQLARDINIPEKLSNIGAKEELLPLVARDALKSIQLKFNVRNASEKEILVLLQKAY